MSDHERLHMYHTHTVVLMSVHPSVRPSVRAVVLYSMCTQVCGSPSSTTLFTPSSIRPTTKRTASPPLSYLCLPPVSLSRGGGSQAEEVANGQALHLVLGWPQSGEQLGWVGQFGNQLRGLGAGGVWVGGRERGGKGVCVWGGGWYVGSGRGVQ